jgi:uncharacterized protein YjiS (DUF1127 family)
MKITYTSVDGKNFDTEYECRSHEEFLSEKSDLILKGIQAHLSKEQLEGVGFNKKAKHLLEVFPVIEQIIKTREGKGKRYLNEVANIIRLYCSLEEQIRERGQLANLEERIEEDGGVFHYHGE